MVREARAVEVLREIEERGNDGEDDEGDWESALRPTAAAGGGSRTGLVLGGTCLSVRREREERTKEVGLGAAVRKKEREGEGLMWGRRERGKREKDRKKE